MPTCISKLIYLLSRSMYIFRCSNVDNIKLHSSLLIVKMSRYGELGLMFNDCSTVTMNINLLKE